MRRLIVPAPGNLVRALQQSRTEPDLVYTSKLRTTTSAARKPAPAPKTKHTIIKHSQIPDNPASCASTAISSATNPFLSLPTFIYRPRDHSSDGNPATNLCSHHSNGPTAANPVQEIQATLPYIVGFWQKCPDAEEWLLSHMPDPYRSSYAMMVVEDDLGREQHNLISDERC